MVPLIKTHEVLEAQDQVPTRRVGTLPEHIFGGGPVRASRRIFGEGADNELPTRRVGTQP